MTNSEKYADIINLERPRSQTHPPMSIANRAAQFSPYAALSGHQELIQNDELNASAQPNEPELVFLQTDEELE